MSAANVFNIFAELADRGTTVLVVTHDRELVHSVPRVFELVDGMIGETTLAAAAARRTQELRAADAFRDPPGHGALGAPRRRSPSQASGSWTDCVTRGAGSREP